MEPAERKNLGGSRVPNAVKSAVNFLRDHRLIGLVLVLCGLFVGACSSGTSSEDSGQNESGQGVTNPTTSPVATPDSTADPAVVVSGAVRDFGNAPPYPSGPSDAAALGALDTILATLASRDALAVDPPHADELATIAATGDARFAWAISDILRFTQGSQLGEGVVATMEELTGTTFDPLSPWGDSVDHLIAWDGPAHDGYAAWKPRLLGAIDPRWEPLFANGDRIEARHVSWGGVFIDDRPLGELAGCVRCIPALDDPAVTDAAGGDWYPDDATVFGVVIDGEARAYPKNIMQVHEMVNDTLGGRRIAIPYCTLCGSAQAYLTDELGDDFEAPVLRTSGLLIRSNKMMYELHTGSFVDTFLGEATSGPLAEANVTFNQVSVVASTWKDWREAHPETTIVAQDGGIGRSYDDDPLQGRDDDGPIFPIGDTDPRLPVQQSVVGVIDPEGRPVAFHADAARAALLDGERVTLNGVEVQLSGSGLRAVGPDGDVQSHEAFWFAWSQFHPDTAVWPLDQ
jgi:hypothetical protein